MGRLFFSGLLFFSLTDFVSALTLKIGIEPEGLEIFQSLTEEREGVQLMLAADSSRHRLEQATIETELNAASFVVRVDLLVILEQPPNESNLTQVFNHDWPTGTVCEGIAAAFYYDGNLAHNQIAAWASLPSAAWDHSVTFGSYNSIGDHWPRVAEIHFVAYGHLILPEPQFGWLGSLMLNWRRKGKSWLRFFGLVAAVWFLVRLIKPAALTPSRRGHL